MACTVLLLLLLVIITVVGAVSISPAAPGIKQESFKDDPRRSILFDRFSYGRDGLVSISVAGAKVSSTLAEPDASAQLVGFFLISDEALFEAITLEPPLTMILYPDPESSSSNCVLHSPYIIPLFTFADLDGEGRFNRTFPVTYAAKYSLFFASCVPPAKVTMEVQTHMYNTNLAGRAKEYETYHRQVQQKAPEHKTEIPKETILDQKE